MTFLRDEGHIKVIEASREFSRKKHYEVQFELVMIVNNRDLRFQARWPAGGQVHGEGQISIAAAFRPGTG